MYNNVYQEYMNNIVGMPYKYETNLENSANNNTINNFQGSNITANIELEKCYPELYKLLYPMVQTACMKNTKPLTEETIDEMVNEIYKSFNADEEIKQVSENKKSETRKIQEPTMQMRNQEAEGKNRGESSNNIMLNDLIKILIIRELLGRPGKFPPAMPIFPPREPVPGRPPFRPREFRQELQNSRIYEEPYIYYNFDEFSMF